MGQLLKFNTESVDLRQSSAINIHLQVSCKSLKQSSSSGQVFQAVMSNFQESFKQKADQGLKLMLSMLLEKRMILIPHVLAGQAA